MKPRGPEGRLVLGTGSGDVSNSLDSAVGLAVRGNRGFGQGSLLAASSDTTTSCYLNRERMNGPGAPATSHCSFAVMTEE